ELLVDGLLRETVFPIALADVAKQGPLPGVLQERGVRERVVEDDVGERERPHPTKGDEPGIARASSDQVHLAHDAGILLHAPGRRAPCYPLTRCLSPSFDRDVCASRPPFVPWRVKRPSCPAT